MGDVGRVGSPGFVGTGKTGGGGGELVEGGGETGPVGPTGGEVTTVVGGGGGGGGGRVVVVVVGGDAVVEETVVVCGLIVDIGGGGGNRGTVTVGAVPVGVRGDVDRVVGPKVVRVTVVVEAGRVIVTDVLPVPLAVAVGAKRDSMAPAVICVADTAAGFAAADG